MSGPLKKIQGKQIKPNFNEKVTAPEMEAEVKMFKVKHPTYKNKSLVHSCLEGPEIGIYFRGKTKETIINLPEYFKNFIDYNSITVHLTPIGEYTSLYVKSINEELNTISIGIPLKNSKYPLEYSFIIFAERIDRPKLEIVQDIKSTIEIKKPSFWKKVLNYFNI